MCSVYYNIVIIKKQEKKPKVKSSYVDTYNIGKLSHYFKQLKGKKPFMNNITRQASLGDIEAKSTLYKIFSEKYRKEIDCWANNLYSKKNWMDIEDMKQDIYIESVEYHIKNHKHYNLALPDDYLIKKSII